MGPRSVQSGWFGGVGSGGGSGASSGVPTPRTGTPASSGRKPPGSGSGEDAFPALPAAPKPLTSIFGYGTGAVRRDMGGNKSTGFSWGSGADAGSSAAGGAETSSSAEAEAGGGKGGKKKKKQVLVQWG